MSKGIRPTSPIVLMYHSVPRVGTLQPLNVNAFEEQIVFLKRNCTFIRPEEHELSEGTLRRPAVLLTFDDGFRNNAEIAAPILRRHCVPATFFVASRHCTPGKYLWFTYLRMLEKFFPGEFIRLDGKVMCLKGEQRKEVMRDLTGRLLALKPHPEAMYKAIESQLPPLESFVPAAAIADEAEGMSPAQLRDLARDPLFTIGSHTLDHPKLTRCSPGEAERQIGVNKSWLESVTGKRCDQFSYPQADFNSATIQCCKILGFRQAFATERVESVDNRFAIRRIGIYSRALAPLAVKLWFGHYLPMTAIQKVLAYRERRRTAAIDNDAASWQRANA